MGLDITLFIWSMAIWSVVQQQREAKTLAYKIQHLPNPARHFRVEHTGLSKHLQKQFQQNENIGSFLVKVQGEISSTAKEGCEQDLSSTE